MMKDILSPGVLEVREYSSPEPAGEAERVAFSELREEECARQVSSSPRPPLKKEGTSYRDYSHCSLVPSLSTTYLVAVCKIGGNFILQTIKMW